MALGKKIIIIKNATAYTWDWDCHLVVDRASLQARQEPGKALIKALNLLHSKGRLQATRINTWGIKLGLNTIKRFTTECVIVSHSHPRLIFESKVE